ncbi:hypothetical protein BWI93_22350 [Siphonobacter sp. BAB-5385]|nr:hypothetical protein BWI93_22350 [Siphonobacter sp. BAB-5385]
MVFFQVISRLPLTVLYWFSDFLFVLIYYVFGYRKQVVLGNLAAAFPEKSEAERQAIAKKFFRNFCDLMVETVKSLTISRESIARRMKLENSEVLHSLIHQKKRCL